MAKPNARERDEFFDEHLPYEISMLRFTFLELQQPVAGPLGNVLIEAFCLHARNLIEFFKNKDSCDFDPREFTAAGHRLHKSFLPGALLMRINEQISHLTANRTVISAEKIGPADRLRMFMAIEGEVTRFASGLSLIYRPRWQLPLIVPRAQP